MVEVQTWWFKIPAEPCWNEIEKRISAAAAAAGIDGGICDQSSSRTQHAIWFEAAAEPCWNEIEKALGFKLEPGSGYLKNPAAVELGKLAAGKTSAAKKNSSRQNGKLGGRPSAWQQMKHDTIKQFGSSAWLPGSSAFRETSVFQAISTSTVKRWEKQGLIENRGLWVLTKRGYMS